MSAEHASADCQHASDGTGKLLSHGGRICGACYNFAYHRHPDQAKNRLHDQKPLLHRNDLALLHPGNLLVRTVIISLIQWLFVPSFCGSARSMHEDRPLHRGCKEGKNTHQSCRDTRANPIPCDKRSKTTVSREHCAKKCRCFHIPLTFATITPCLEDHPT